MALSGSGGGGGAGAIRAGRAYVELLLKDNAFYRDLRRLEKGLTTTGNRVALGGAALLGAGTSVVGGIAAAGKYAVDKATAISQLATKLNVTTEDLSSFAYAASMTGQRLEDVEGHFENFSERVAQAANGAGEGAAAFNRLGLDAAKLKRMPITDALIETLDALGKVTDNTERLGLMSSLGGDQFQKLNALARMGAGGIAKLRTEAVLAGQVLSGDDAVKAVSLGRALSSVYLGVESVFMAVGQAIIPAADQIDRWKTIGLSAIAMGRDFVRNNREIVVATLAAGVGLVVVGGALIAGGLILSALGTAFGAIASVCGTVVSVLGTVLSPIGLVTAAVIGLTAALVVGLGHAFFTATKEGQQSVTWMKGYVGELGGYFKDTWSGIGDAVKAGDIELAVKIATQAISLVWNRFTATLQDSWEEFVSFYVGFWESGTMLIRQNFIDLGTFIKLQINSISAHVAEAMVAMATEYPEATSRILRTLGAGQLDEDLQYLAKDPAQAMKLIASGKANEAKKINADNIADSMNLNKIFGGRADERNAKQKANQDAAAAQLEADKAALTQLRLKAAFKAFFGGKGGAADGKTPEIQQIAKSIRGTFAGGTIAGQVFGFVQTVQQQQLGELKKLNGQFERFIFGFDAIEPAAAPVFV